MQDDSDSNNNNNNTGGINNPATTNSNYELRENEVKLLNSDDINQHQQHTNASIITTITSTTTATTADLGAPLVIRKLNSQSSIKVSIRHKSSGEKIETRENENNENINKQSADTIKNTEINNNNNNSTTPTTSSANNSNTIHVYRYTPPLLSNKLRYKDPKTGKLFNPLLQQQQQTSPNNSIDVDDGMNNVLISNSKSATARIIESNTSNHNKGVTPRLQAVALFRTDSASRLSKPKSIETNKSSYYLHNRSDDMSPLANPYNWKGKNERNPMQLAPDRLYLNTYMGSYFNANNSNSSSSSSNTRPNSAKIKNIKFQGVSPRFTESRGPKHDKPLLTTGQVFEHIFDMNKQFLNVYYPQQNKKQTPRKQLLSRSHTLPGHMALESAATQLYDNNQQQQQQQSKRPLKFENPSIYKVPGASSMNTNRSSTINTSRSAKSSVNNYDPYNDVDVDVDSIEIPIVLKSPNSVNSYISYLRNRNQGIFRSAKA